MDIELIRSQGYEVEEAFRQEDGLIVYYVCGPGISCYVREDQEFAVPTAEEAEAAEAAALEQEAVDTAEAATAATIRQRLLEGITTADTHIANMSAATPTAAQQKAALLFSLRAVKALARLEVRKLDSAD